jgi:hypothetical protein
MKVSTVSKCCPKTFISQIVVKTAISDAVVQFNGGNVGRVKSTSAPWVHTRSVHKEHNHCRAFAENVIQKLNQEA